MKYRAVDFG